MTTHYEIRRIRCDGSREIQKKEIYREAAEKYFVAIRSLYQYSDEVKFELVAVTEEVVEI